MQPDTNALRFLVFSVLAAHVCRRLSNPAECEALTENLVAVLAEYLRPPMDATCQK